MTTPEVAAAAWGVSSRASRLQGLRHAHRRSGTSPSLALSAWPSSNVLFIAIVTILPLGAWFIYNMLTNRQAPPAALYALSLSLRVVVGGRLPLEWLLAQLGSGLFILASLLILTVGGIVIMVREARAATRGSDEGGA